MDGPDPAIPAEGAARGVDGYVAWQALDDLASRFALVRDDGGRIVLRVTAFPIQTVRGIVDESAVLAALDLAGSLDVGERRAGLAALTTAVERAHG